MAHPAHEFPQKLFEIIRNAVGVLLIIVLYYILQHIFDADFACSCQQTNSIDDAGVLYMLVPPLILTWVVNIIESFHKRRFFSRIQNLCHDKAWSYFVKVLINYVCLTTVWMATVFIDGDWYFCLKTNQNPNQTGLPCKNKEKLSDEEIRIKAAYESDSNVIGFGLMAAVIVVWTLFEILRRVKKCCNWSCCKICPPQYELVYEDLLAEQLSEHLEEELKGIAKKRVEAICRSYLDVIVDSEAPKNNAGAENAGAENVGAENVGAENVGAENVGAENVGAENAGAENAEAENAAAANAEAENAGAGITLGEAWQKMSASDFCLKSEESAQVPNIDADNQPGR